MILRFKKWGFKKSNSKALMLMLSFATNQWKEKNTRCLWMYPGNGEIVKPKSDWLAFHLQRLGLYFKGLLYACFESCGGG
jgi:hypothetical protein